MPIFWPTIPASQILDIITISDINLEKVQAVDKATKETVIKLLNIELTQGSDYKIMLVYMPPGKKLWIHSDKPVDIPEDIRIAQAVLLPLKSCDNLVWNWYKATDSSRIQYTGEPGSWKRVPFLPRDASNLIDTVICNRPFISDIGTFHALENTGDEPAIAISIRLMPWSYGTVQTCNELPPISGIVFQ
jgi:mannose-6-phosphate isomerase-like protein (cupin superfamily)